MNSDQRSARSVVWCKLPSHDPALCAAGVGVRRLYPDEAVGLEQVNCSDVAADLTTRSPVSTGYPSTIVAPPVRACSVAPASRSCLSPRLRNPPRTTKQTIDQGSRSSSKWGIVREFMSRRYVDFGATEHQPATWWNGTGRQCGHGKLLRSSAHVARQSGQRRSSVPTRRTGIGRRVRG